MILKLDHVGIAVRSIDESLRFWELALGLQLEGREAVPTESVDVAFLPAGKSRVELLQATTGDSAVGRFLAKRGPGIHHLTFEVDVWDEASKKWLTTTFTKMFELENLDHGEGWDA